MAIAVTSSTFNDTAIWVVASVLGVPLQYFYSAASILPFSNRVPCHKLLYSWVWTQPSRAEVVSYASGGQVLAI
jgi:hypothetical protein